MHDLPLACGVVGRPVGKIRAVGVAGAGEVGPVSADLLGQPPVFRTPDRFGPGVERVKDIFDLVGVEGAEDCEVILVTRGAQVEMVAIDRRFARRHLGFEPAPRGVGDEVIACEVAWLGLFCAGLAA